MRTPKDDCIVKPGQHFTLPISTATAKGQTRSPRAVLRNPFGASGDPQITDSLAAAPKRVGHVPILL